MIKLGLVMSIALAMIVTIACNGPQNTNIAVNTVNSTAAHTPLPAATIDEMASGEKVYATNCAKCHKDNGTGGEVVIEGKKLKADDLTTEKRKAFTDEKLIHIIETGIEDEGMPAFKGKISEGEMRDLVKYIRVDLQKMPAETAPKS